MSADPRVPARPEMDEVLRRDEMLLREARLWLEAHEAPDGFGTRVLFAALVDAVAGRREETEAAEAARAALRQQLEQLIHEDEGEGLVSWQRLMRCRFCFQGWTQGGRFQSAKHRPSCIGGRIEALLATPAPEPQEK
jgi:hypothetical protein